MFFQNKSSLLLIFLLAVVTGGCKSDTTTATKTIEDLPLAEVTVARVTAIRAPNQVELVGTIQAVDQAEISSKITGNILSMSVDLGSKVKKGDILVQLSAGEISAKVQQALAQLEQAKRNLAREEKLLKKNAATPETVKSLRDTVKISQATFLESQTMLNYTTISAPFDGIVTKKIANTGDLATPGKPLLRMEGENKLQIVTDIPEAMVHDLQIGDTLEASIPAVNSKISGQVTEISPTADPSSRTTPIKIRISKEPQLRSGQFARVLFLKSDIETLAVPKASIMPYGQLERVFVVNENRAQLRLVRTGGTIETADGTVSIEIISGVDKGEEVITSTPSNVQSGQPLKVL